MAEAMKFAVTGVIGANSKQVAVGALTKALSEISLEQKGKMFAGGADLWKVTVEAIRAKATST